LLYGFEYMSWGEPSGFSAWGTCANTLPSHLPPMIGQIGDFTSEVVHPTGSPSIHFRRTKLGIIEVDTAMHTGRFVTIDPWVLGRPSGSALTAR